MKGDHLFEEVKLQPTNAMFSKLHSHSPHTLSPLPHHPQQLQLQHHQHNNTSEEDDSSGGATGGGGGGTLDFGQTSGGGGGVSGGGEVGSLSKKPKTEGGHSGGSGGGCGGGDGASIEVSRRPRGRPPGSKNKPKPPIIITRDAECAMRPHILEISSGLDIIDAMARFARQRNVGVCVLTASGTVVNVSLRQPSTTPGSTVTFHGRFDILSISATYLPPGNSVPSSNGCTITLAGPQGQIFGGSVVGTLIAASNVFLVATSFSNPTYHRLPIEEDDQRDASESQSHSHSHSHQQLACTPPPPPGLDHQSNSSDSGANAMTMYNCTHLPTDVIWTPTARPPPSQHF